jgi:ribose transport system substrate-binding protein
VYAVVSKIETNRNHAGSLNMIRRETKLRALLLLLLSSFLPAGCSAGSRDRPRRAIGLSVLILTNPFFKEIADSMREEAAKYGYEVIAVSGDENIARQDRQVDDFLVKQVDAIVLCPCDSKAVGPVIQKANNAGVPVFTVDIASTAENAKVVSHIATNNYSGGEQAAQAMIEALGEVGGKVAILDHKHVESCQERVKGFKKIIDDHNRKPGVGKISIVAELPSGGSKDQGYKSAEDLLQAHGDLVGIFAINDPSALGARAALEKAGKANRIKIIGFDGQPEGKQAIKDGKIYADPIQYPDEIGRKAAQIIARYFDGEIVKPQYPIETKLYRQADGQKDPTLK